MNRTRMTPYLDNFPLYGYDLRSYPWHGNQAPRFIEKGVGSLFFAHPSIWHTLNNGSVLPLWTSLAKLSKRF